MTELPDHITNKLQITFKPWPSARHIGVMALMAVLCGFMYCSATDADFQFDDEPNITKCPVHSYAEPGPAFNQARNL